MWFLVIPIAALAVLALSRAGTRSPDTVTPSSSTSDRSTDRTRRLAFAIIRTFESGSPGGDYGAVALLRDRDRAGVSYGASQATDGSGALDEVVAEYIRRRGRFADDLREFVDELERNATRGLDPANLPAWARRLFDLLARAGDEDPVMQAVQDDVFARRYYDPALAKATELGLSDPLSIAVLYDTWVQSSPSVFAAIRNDFPELPPSRGGDGRIWTTAYVNARRHWLATFDNGDPDHSALVRTTTYRMDAFRKLIQENRWGLETPFTIDRPRATIT